MANPHVVRGEIMLPPDTQTFNPAAVVVALEDISRADAPSETIARLLLEPGTLHGSDVIAFELPVESEALDGGRLYSVRVHIDRSGSGAVERGDFITMQTYPVLTHGHGDHVSIAVRPV